MRFANPQILYFLIGLPFIFFLWRRSRKKSDGSLIYSDTRMLRRIGRSPFNFFWAVHFITLLALGLMIISLARPQAVKTRIETTSEGIDILLAVDISTSMSAEDFKPLNRLHVAKSVVADFIRGRSSDRIGLILFSAHSFIKCPLTLDYNVLLTLLQDVDLTDPEDDGTAIGTAIVSALNRLRTSSAKSKVIILLTDGVNNRGSISPLDAARISRRMNVRIYTIGVGSNAPARYLVQEPEGTKRYVTALVKIDEESLKAIAAITGGQYFKATNSASLSEIYKQIGKMEKTKVTEKRYVQYRDLYAYFLLVSLSMVFGQVILANTAFRKIP